MNEQFDAHYQQWKILKYKLIKTEKRPPKFNERDIWWCSVGINVGYDINGKHHLSERPALIIKKFNSDMFFGLPLTTQQKLYRTRYPIIVKGKKADVILDQGKTYSADRLNRRERIMSPKDFKNIKNA